MSHDQDDFDWVSAQAKCNAASLFERLRSKVRDDVLRRNGIFDRGNAWKFEFEDDGDAFEVSRVAAAGSSVDAVVRFERAGPRIHVHSEEVDVELTAVVALDVSGQCRFVVGEAMYSDWEIRRMALETLFFEEPEDSD
jgi:hypothetical protein